MEMIFARSRCLEASNKYIFSNDYLDQHLYTHLKVQNTDQRRKQCALAHNNVPVTTNCMSDELCIKI